MMRLLHMIACGKPTEIVAKTYRPDDVYDYEMTQYLVKCATCGATWKETLYGKEVENAGNQV